MSWSWETVDAVISGGLPGTPVLFPTFVIILPLYIGAIEEPLTSP